MHHRFIADSSQKEIRESGICDNRHTYPWKDGEIGGGGWNEKEWSKGFLLSRIDEES